MIRRVVIPLALLAGCAKSTQISSTFSTDWLNDSGNSIARVEQALRATPHPPNVGVAVGISETALVGKPLDGGARWSRNAVPDTLPSIAGELVLYSSRGKLTALDAKTGAPRWSLDVAGYWLRGAGDDGTTTVATLGTSDRRTSLLLAVRHDGSVRTRLETPIALGRPAARGGIGFVPWGNQYVSAIDLESGEEQGRLLTRDVTSHALAVAGELFFGEKAMLHFDEKVRFAATNQADRAALPERLLPGRPRWLGPGAELPVVDPGAHAKIQIYAAPAWNGSQLHFASDAFVATYFRAVMGFDARTAELRWVQALGSPVVGGASGANGFVLCSADGKLQQFGAKGERAAPLELGTAVRSCVVDASTYRVPAGESPGSLAAQLDRTLAALDPEMAAAQAFLVAELGRIEDPLVTKTLIDLTTSSRVAPDIRLRARELLAQRRSGAEFMLASLERRYDFLSGEILPPPVGPLADALGAMKEWRAATLLARHLNDPSTEANDVQRAARALEVLATPAEVPALRTFFALYRATADEPALVQAVVSAAKALVRIGGTDGRALVDRAARDPLTQPEIARELLAMSSSPPAPSAQAQKR